LPSERVAPSVAGAPATDAAGSEALRAFIPAVLTVGVVAGLPFLPIFALLEVFVFLALAEVLGAFGEKARVPPIVVYLLLGMLLSGFALGGVVNRAVGIDLFDASSPHATYIALFADLSVILLLFAAGLEGGFRALRSAGAPVVLGAIAGDLVPFAITVAVAMAFFPIDVALLLGVAMAPTSSAVVAALRRSEGLERTTGGQFLLNLAALDDVVALVLLSAVLTILGGQADVLAVTGGVVGSVVAWLILLVAAVVVIPRLLKIPTLREARGMPFLFLFGLVAVVLALGLSAVIGAFIAGLAVAESLVAERTRLITDVLLLFFGALFFVVVGAEFDARLVADPVVLTGGLAFAGLATVGKLLGVYPFCLQRLKDPATARAVALGMIPRGEIGLVVGGLGLAAGIIDREVLGIIVLVSLLTTLVGSFVFRAVAKDIGPRPPAAAPRTTEAAGSP
jgi:Kef-type K+ transport system membrane component KefB